MKTRIITAAIAAPLLVLLLIFGNEYAIALAVFFASLIGLKELNRAVGLSEKKAVCVIGYIGGAAVLVCNIFFREYVYAALVVLLLALFLERLICYEKIKTEDIALELFAVIYVPFLFSHVSLVRNLPNGRYLVWLVIVGAFITDSAAYFVGVFFGRHKMCPVISPKKTIEGAVGGLLGCGAAFLVMGVYYNRLYDDRLNLGFMFLLGLVCAAVSEVGDLAASVIKREFGIKDYGKLLPGHGGIMDRCDSLIFVAPFVYYLLQLLRFLTK